MKKPIYLYVTGVFPGGGSWRGGYGYDAVKAMMKDGRYDVRVIRLGDEIFGQYEIDGILVRQFRLPNPGYLYYFPYLVNRKLENDFLEQLRESGIDVFDVAVCHINLILHLESVATAVKRANPKCFVMLHHHYSAFLSFKIGKFGHVPVVSELFYLYRRHQYQLVDACVYCSNMARELAHKCYSNELGVGELRDIRDGMLFRCLLPRIKARRELVCYNGIDRRQFNSQSRMRGRSGFRIGCVANFIKTKGQIVLIRAFERVRDRMPDARLIFVGSGPELQKCQDYVREHVMTEEVSFVHEMTHDKMAVFFQTLDLFVLPSVWEAFGCVYAEANACGVPVIGTNSIPLREILSEEDREASLAAPWNVEDLADKIYGAYVGRLKLQTFAVNLDIDDAIPQFLDHIMNGKLKMGYVK